MYKPPNRATKFTKSAQDRIDSLKSRIEVRKTHTHTQNGKKKKKKKKKKKRLMRTPSYLVSSFFFSPSKVGFLLSISIPLPPPLFLVIF